MTNPVSTLIQSATKTEGGAPAEPLINPAPVGDKALSGISSFADTLTKEISRTFPSVARSERALIESGVLTAGIILLATLAYVICGRIQAGFIRRLLRAFIVFIGVGGIASVWVPEVLAWFGEGIGARIAGSGITIFAALAITSLLWEGANRLLLNYYLEQVGATSQRFRTLLPLFRRAILIFLIVVVSMIIMTELGISIAPLLAGAGIIGVALGFGAQKLVQDFLTGLFIVLEDAIALGDVVQIGTDVGTVEDMTLRTVRLRDLEGAVHILPFSEVRTILNRSKGYAFALIDMRIAYGADIARVEEAIRAVATRMKNDPEWGDAMIDEVELMGIQLLADNHISYRFRQKCTSSSQFALKRHMQSLAQAALIDAGVGLALSNVPIMVGNREAQLPHPFPMTTIQSEES